MFNTSGSKKRAQVAVLVLYKIEIKPKTVTRQSNYVMIKGSIHQEDTIIVYVCMWVWVYTTSEHLNILSKCYYI